MFRGGGDVFCVRARMTPRMSVMTTVVLFPEKHVKDVLERPTLVLETLGISDATEAPRRFEFTKGSSDKFWEVSVGEFDFTVRFGKRGTKGQTKTKEVDDPQEAVDALINEKVRSGYVEVDTLEFASESVQLEKAAAGLHFLLTGTAYKGEPPLDFLMSGGAEVDAMDFEYGPGRVFNAAEVKTISEALEGFTAKSLRAAYRPEEMNVLQVYPANWIRDGERGFEWLSDSFVQLRKEVKKAVTKKYGMLISVS